MNEINNEQNDTPKTSIVSQTTGNGKEKDPFSADNNSVFVNKGLERWEKVRSQWLNQSHGNAVASPSVRSRSCYPCQGELISRNRGGAIDLNLDDVIDLIVTNRWRVTADNPKNKVKFSHPIPLPQMVDILVDLWEAEGLD